MIKEEELEKSLEQIQENINASKKALKAHEDHIKELKAIIKEEPAGKAKDELVKVRNNAKKHAEEL